MFYQFINFWKILDLGIPKPKERSAWIEANVEEIFDGVEWKKEIQATGETITDYLNDSCRNAISHVHRTPTVDPDNYEDNTRLSKDSKLVEGLAKRLINSGAFG